MYMCIFSLGAPVFSVISVNLKKASMASENIVMKKTIHVVLISFALVFGLLVFSLISTFVIAYRGVDFC